MENTDSQPEQSTNQLIQQATPQPLAHSKITYRLFGLFNCLVGIAQLFILVSLLYFVIPQLTGLYKSQSLSHQNFAVTYLALLMVLLISIFNIVTGIKLLKSSQKDKYFLPGVILTILFFIVSGPSIAFAITSIIKPVYTLTQHADGAPKSSFSFGTPSSPSDLTANWKTYTNTKYHYQIKYPSDWQIDEELFAGPDSDALEMVDSVLLYKTMEKPYSKEITEKINRIVVSISVFNNPQKRTLREFITNGRYGSLNDIEKIAFLSLEEAFKGERENGTDVYFSKGKQVFEIRVDTHG